MRGLGTKAALITIALAAACGGGTKIQIDANPCAGGGCPDATPVPPPSVDSFSPIQGAPGTPVTIQGSNLGGQFAVVRFHGTMADPPTGDDTTLMVTVPNGATTGRITVTTARGTGISPTDFTVPGTSGVDAAPPMSDAAP